MNFRRREIPSFEQFRADIAKLAETARTFQGQSAALLEALRKLPSPHLARPDHPHRRILRRARQRCWPAI